MRNLTISLSVIVFLVLSAVEAICAAPTQFPDTPAGHQGAAWLEAFNSGSRESFGAFLQKNFPSKAENLDCICIRLSWIRNLRPSICLA